MNELHGIDGLTRIPPGSVVSIGNFDGVHRGHGHILRTADALRASSASGRVAVVTFEPHPLAVLRPEFAPPRLTPPARKRELLAAAGVDDCVVLPPDREVLDLTAERFWEILRDRARPAHLVEGESFNFGKGRGGTIERLREWTAASSVRLHVVGGVTVPLLDLQIAPVSSSLVRWLVAYGRVRDAAICLGRPYELEGPVIRGHQRGRQIGIPTANLDCHEQLVPDDGVYAGRCTVDGATYSAAVSIGSMPTFGEHSRQVEAHLIGFDGDLYGRSIRVELIDWLREQRKFKGVDALKEQLAMDIAQAQSLARMNPAEPIANDSAA